MKISRILVFFITASLFNAFQTIAYAHQESSFTIVKTDRGIEKIKTRQKVVALTFDDGPSKYTPEILEILRSYGIRGTFFFIGQNMKYYPATVRQAYLDGNVIANHTYSHPWLTKRSDEQIDNELITTNKIIHNIIGECATLFRPPYGACSARTAKAISDLGFISIGWSDMANEFDVNHTTAEKIASEIIMYARPGGIIGLHDGGGNRAKSVKALVIVINRLTDMGYEFVTIPELLDIEGYIPKKPEKYISEKPGS